MIKGMTGFGYAPLSSGKIKGFVEIKSVNHRYLDVGYYLPIGFASIESSNSAISFERWFVDPLGRPAPGRFPPFDIQCS